MRGDEGPGGSWDPTLVPWVVMTLGDQVKITQGTMFGLPAFFVVGRLFACVSETGVALRIPLEMAQTFVGADHLRPFAPFGRAPMRGWLHRAVGLEADTSRERALLIATCDYVRTLR